jgi:hypothetical protein
MMNQYRPLLFASLLVLLLAVPFTLAFAAEEASAQTPGQSNLRINEFLADNNGGLADPDEPGSFPDWIELYNPGPTEVSLDGLALTDDPNQPTRSLLPDGLTIPAGGFLVLFADSQPDQGPLHLSFSLGRSGETIALYHAASGTLIDRYDFGPQNENISEGRQTDGGDTWVFFNSPTPGATNELAPPLISNVQRALANPTAAEAVTVSATITDERGIANVVLYYLTQLGAEPTAVPMTAANGVYSAQIPALPDGTVVYYFVEATDIDGLTGLNPLGARNQAEPVYYRYTVGYQPPALFINEIMASNLSITLPGLPADQFPDWIEIYNAGTEPVSLDSMFLTDDPTEPTKYPIPFGLDPVPPGGYVIFYADSSPELGAYHTSFSLSNTEGEHVGLYAAGGNAVVDTYTFAPMGSDTSVGRYPDGSNTWAQSGCSTPGATNTPCKFDHAVRLPLIVAQ